jgi:putative nucleotidyltransferase with HDIG domain
MVVESIALYLAQKLIDTGHELDSDLISAGALLHDIAKMPAMELEVPHGELGSDIAQRYGFFTVASIIRQHVRLDAYDDGCISEAGLVNYADKRVNHEAVVSVDERFSYLFERYGRSPEARERLETMYQLTKKLEANIFMSLPFGPQKITDRICEGADSGFYSR